MKHSNACRQRVLAVVAQVIDSYAKRQILMLMRAAIRTTAISVPRSLKSTSRQG
jgi:hypothetical protein